jgi:type IX secretion system substrate protein
VKPRWYIFISLLLFAGSVSYSQPGSSASASDPREPSHAVWKSINGNIVLLTWDTPEQSAGLENYNIWRKWRGDALNLWTKVANVNRELQYEDLTVQPGDQLDYAIEANYGGNDQFAVNLYVDVAYPEHVAFLSTPPATAKMGKFYEYEILLEYNQDATLILDFDGRQPEGMEFRTTAGDAPRIIWDGDYINTPDVYDFTIFANVIRNEDTSRASQDVRIIVAESFGKVDGQVTAAIGGAPIPYTFIYFYLFPENSDPTKFKIKTDELGNFEVDYVPVGEFIAYAEPGTNEYIPRYFSTVSNGQSISDAAIQLVQQDKTTTLKFRLNHNLATAAAISGIARLQNGSAIEGAKAHFIRKNNFIIIGDAESADNPAILESWLNSKIDTTVLSDADGQFTALLPVRTDYYIVIEKEGYFDCFNYSLFLNTNALESRAFTVNKQGDNPEYIYTMVPKATEVELVSVSGQVRREDNGVGSNSAVFLIENQMKSNYGAGGGATYSRIRSVLTDSNGVYLIDNVPVQQANGQNYILLAVPLDRDVVPKYYSAFNDAVIFDDADKLTLVNTQQGIDFELRSSQTDGLGTIYGRVAIQDDKNIVFISGALVYAFDKAQGQVVGYAVSDSLGYYSIPGLQSGLFDVIADHPQWGAETIANNRIDYQSPRDAGRSKNVNLFIYTKTVLSVDRYNPNIVPATIELYQNYPNPFNPSTNITFGLNRRTAVRLSVLNTLGQEVQVLEEASLRAGTHTYTFDASDLPSGMYYYQLRGSGQILSKSMMLVK